MDVTAEKRLYRTAAGTLVPEGHADARWLFCVPGQRISGEEAARYGLVKVSTPTQPAAKPGPKPAAKRTAKRKR